VNPLSRLIDPAALVPVLQAVALAMALILLALILLLVVQKVVLERRYREEREAADRHANALAHGTRVEHLAVDARRLSERRALARALRNRGTDVAPGQLHGAPWYGELVRRLQRDARRKAWGERVAAFEMLGELGAAELRPFLEQAAQRETHPQAYAACLVCLAKFSDQAAGLTALWNQLQAKPALSGSFNEGLFQVAIEALSRRSSRQAAAEVLQRLLAGANPHDALALDAIRAIGKSGLVSLAPQLVALWRAPEASKSLRIACVRAVGMLQPEHPLLLSALSDRDWEVQASGAKYLRGTTPAVIAGLSDCLRSPGFYVRLNAATTLASLGEDGRAVLEETLMSCDAFAREISRYALSVLDGFDALRLPDSDDAPRLLERAHA
jgi:hypothetical protein